MADITADQVNAKSIRVDDSNQIVYTPVGTVVNHATNVLQCSSVDDYDNIQDGDVILVGNQPYDERNIATVDSKILPDLLNVTKQTEASVPTFFRVLKPRLYLGKFEPGMFTNPDNLAKLVVGGTSAYLNGVLGVSYITSESEVNPFSDHIDLALSSHHDINLNADNNVNVNAGININLEAPVVALNGTQLRIAPDEVVLDQNTRTIVLENSVPGNEVSIAGDIKHVGSFTGGYGDATFGYTNLTANASNSLTLGANDHLIIGSEPTKDCVVTFWQENYVYKNDVTISSEKEYNVTSTGNLSMTSPESTYGGDTVNLNASAGLNVSSQWLVASFPQGVQIDAAQYYLNGTQLAVTTTQDLVLQTPWFQVNGAATNINSDSVTIRSTPGNVLVDGVTVEVGTLVRTQDISVKSTASFSVSSADVELSSSGPLKLLATTVDLGTSGHITSEDLTIETTVGSLSLEPTNGFSLAPTGGDIFLTAPENNDLQLVTSGTGQVVCAGKMVVNERLVCGGDFVLSGTTQEVTTLSGSFTSQTGSFVTADGDFSTSTGNIISEQGSLIGATADIGYLNVNNTTNLKGVVNIDGPQINAPGATLTVGNIVCTGPQGVNSENEINAEGITVDYVSTPIVSSLAGHQWAALSTDSDYGAQVNYPTRPWTRSEWIEKDYNYLRFPSDYEYNVNLFEDHVYYQRMPIAWNIVRNQHMRGDHHDGGAYIFYTGWYRIQMYLEMSPITISTKLFWFWFFQAWQGPKAFQGNYRILTQWSDNIMPPRGGAKHRYVAKLNITRLLKAGEIVTIRTFPDTRSTMNMKRGYYEVKYLHGDIDYSPDIPPTPPTS